MTKQEEAKEGECARSDYNKGSWNVSDVKGKDGKGWIQGQVVGSVNY